MQTSILGFDTSAINAILRDGSSAEPLLAGLSAGYVTRLNGTTLDEIVAHSSMAERELLRKLCSRLLANGTGDILLPFQEIMKRLATAFESGHPFDWTRVGVRSPEYLNYTLGRDVDAVFEDDTEYETVSAQQRLSAVDAAEQFEQFFLGPRPEYQRIREGRQCGGWPKSAEELMLALRLKSAEYRPVLSDREASLPHFTRVLN